MSEQFKPNTTVAAIIHNRGKFLLVHEIDNGKLVYNQPAGHIEENETIVEAMQREVLEETGLKVIPKELSGIYYLYHQQAKLYYLRFCFIVELDKQLTGTPSDSDIVATKWLTAAEVKQKTLELRSPLVQQCIDDYLAGQRYPLSILKANLAK